MDQLSHPFINPFTDFGFKRLFGSEDYKELLIDFLNTMLPEHHHIKQLSYRKTEQLGNTQVDRKAIFDLYCQSSTGEHFIVEIQRAKQKYFKDRTLFYASFPIQEQALTGDWDFKLSAVYLVGILDFVFEYDETLQNHFFHKVKLVELDTHKVFSDKLTLMYLELPKFQKTEEQLTSHFEKWIYAFKHMPSLHNRPVKLQERIFTRLFEAANIAKFSHSERNEYEDSLKVYRDLKNSLDTAVEEGRAQGIEQGRAEGILEGIEKGFERGIEKGLAEGIEKGLAEGALQKSLDIARNLLLSGIKPEKIAQITGLSPQQIKELEEKL
jgi:predicted transposase/invertase (TIGR01784 family)